MHGTNQLDYPAPVKGWARGYSIILMLLWLFAAGVLHVALLRAKLPATRNDCGIIAGVLAAIGLFAWLRGRSTWALLLLITGIAIVAVVLWNIFFLRYIKASGYELDNFRHVYQTKHAPLYGVMERILDGYYLAPIVAILAVMGLLVLLRERLLEGRLSAWWFVGIQLWLTLLFGLSDGVNWLKPMPEHLPGEIKFRATTTQAAGEQPSLRTLLRHYVQHMPEGTGRMAHYPPGFVLWRDSVLKTLHMRRWVHISIILLASLTALPLAGLMRELGVEARARALALLLFSTAIGVLVYGRADFSVLGMLFTSTALWLLLRGCRSGEWWAGIALGVVYACFVMYVFTSVIMGAVIAAIVIWGLMSGRLDARRTIRTVAVAAVVFIGIFVSLYAWSGFNIYECFQQARADERAELGSGFDDSTRYFLRSSGHIIAYLVATGYALTGFALMGLRRNREHPLLGIVAWAALGGILFAGFSGGFHGETERVWLLFTPLLAVVAGYEWERRTAREGKMLLIGVILLVLLGNCAQELLYKHQARSLRKEVNKRVMPVEE